MSEKNKERKTKDPPEPVEVICPKCGHTKIIYLPKEEIPRCPVCGTQMMIRELLDEGKYY